MLKLVKILGVLAALFATVDRASALSFVATGPDYSFTLTNTTGGVLSIQGLSLSTDLNNPAPNLLPGSVYTPGPGTLANGASFTENVTGLITGTTYFTHLSLSGTNSEQGITITVSAVPLPAGFPLFAMALLALGTLGYFRSRKASNGLAAAA